MSETPTKEQLDKMKANARDFAVWAVDAVHGYTCEYSADPQRHVDEYARHEADFLAVIDMALGFLAMQPRPNAIALKVGEKWIVTMVDKDIMAEGTTCEIAIELLNALAKVEAKCPDHFAAITASPVARLFTVNPIQETKE